MGKGYYYASWGYDFNPDEKGFFRCGCGNQQIFEAGKTLVIMWDGALESSRENYIPWYLQCAFEHLLWRLSLE